MNTSRKSYYIFLILSLVVMILSSINMVTIPDYVINSMNKIMLVITFSLGVIMFITSYIILIKFIKYQNLVSKKVEENRMERNKLLKTIITDELTSLYNHRYFYEYLNKRIKEGLSKFSIVFIDIDNFRSLNDVKGYSIGDIVLIEISKIIRGIIKNKGEVFRYSGNEFVIILESQDVKESLGISEGIRKKVELSKEVQKYSGFLPITISLGISSYPKNSRDIDNLARMAHKALHFGKVMGKNRCQVYNNDIEKILSEKIFPNEGLINSTLALITAIDARDLYTGSHSEQVSKYSILLSEKLNLSDEDRYILEIGGLLHDCGKIGIPDNIINKKGRLTDEEYDVIKSHTIIGNDIIKHIVTDEAIITCIRNHHEKWDGSGYPDGLKGEEIPLYARIVSIADAFHAMSSSRPYRNALKGEDIIKELIDNKGSQFDPYLIDLFVEGLLENNAI